MCKFVSGIVICFLAIFCVWAGDTSSECILLMASIGIATLGAGADAYKKEARDKEAMKEKE